MRVPPTLHVTVRRAGGGTETNVAKLIDHVPEFSWIALEDYLGPLIDWGHLPRLYRALRDRREEVIFCYGVQSHAFVFLAFPFVRHLVGNIRCETDFAGIKGVWKRLFGRRFSFWLSNSKKALAGQSGHVIYNGITIPDHPEEPLYPALARPAMGMLASGNPKKGHLFAVETWKQLGKPGALVLAGNLPDDLRRECEREGAICPGFVEAGPFLRSIDLLLVPSTAEGIPTVILEAAARGVPTLATPVGGVPEMIKHGQTGYVLERNEWLEFLRKTPSDQWRRTGVAAKHQLPNRFSMERMARRFRAAAWLAAHPTFAKRWRARG